MSTPALRPLPTTSLLRPSSTIRRKPLHTYRSPAAGQICPSITLCNSPPYPTHNSTSTRVVLTSSAESSSSSCSLPGTSRPPSPIPIRVKNPPKRKKFPMAPPLPLYHPMGTLALSLPPLDPTIFGLPAPAHTHTEDEAPKQTTPRSCRSATKGHETEHDQSPFVNDVTSNHTLDVPTPSVVAVPEAKDKASPRKRRNGGGGGKRKRKEVDDGDATYPAKRTRVPRGAAAREVAVPLVEEDSLSESLIPGTDGRATPESIALEEKRPERRSTRSAGIRRRSSSASDTTSIAVSVTNPAKDASKTDVDKLSHPDEGWPASTGQSDKEEGELSEEGQPIVP